MRAEHAPVHMGLVDDHESEIREQICPRRMIGQDPEVEHVGIGEHEIAPLANRRPFLARSVTVIDGRADRLRQAEGMERSRLVLGQRLGWIEVQSARLPVRAQNLQRRQLKAQRLPRSGPRSHDRRTRKRRAKRLLLMGVERVDPHVFERGENAVVEIIRNRHQARGARPIRIPMDDPLVVEESGPGLG